MKELSIDSIIEVHRLLKQMGEKTTPQNIASECGVRKTEMMRFINEHRHQFEMTRWTKRDKLGRVVKEWVIVDGVYADPAFNPDAPEYVERRKKEHAIRLNRIEYCGRIYGCCLSDGPKAWENQEGDVEKYAAIAQVRENLSFMFGGIMDSFEVDFKKAFRKKDAEAVFNAMLAAGLVPYVDGGKAVKFEDLIEGEK